MENDEWKKDSLFQIALRGPHPSLSEVLKSARCKIPDASAFGYPNASPWWLHCADARNRHSIHSLWQPGRLDRRYSKEKFKILSAVQGQLQRIQGTPSAKFNDRPIDGKVHSSNQCSDIAFFADVMEIGR